MKTVYVSEDYQNNPVKFLAAVTGLENLLPQLNQRDDAEYLLSGLVNYRTLSQKKRIEYMGYVHNLSDNKAFGMKFYEIAAQQVAQPLWFAWSLTDEELRDLLTNSKIISSVFSKLGFTLAGSVTVQNVSEVLTNASKKGFKKAFSDKAKSTLNIDLGNKIAKGSGAAFAYVTIMATLLYHSAEHDKSRALKELIQRGIIRVSDV